jgi:hypothetical protein
MMAVAKVKFNCGCGYTCDNYVEAAIHVDSTGHSMDCFGAIKPSNPVEEKKTREEVKQK